MDVLLIVLGCIAAVYIWLDSHRTNATEDIISHRFHTNSLIWFFALLLVFTAVFTIFKLAFNINF